MCFRSKASYDLTALDALNEATPMILAEDFRHIGLNLNAASSADYTLTVYASDQESRPDLTSAASATNTYSAVEVVNKDTWASIDWSTWIVIASDGFTRYEINDNSARWVWVKITTFSAWTATIQMALDDNQ